MKNNIFLIGTLGLYLFTSCGPSAEQKAAADKAKMDSVIAATKKATEDSISINKGMTELIERKTLTEDAIPYIQSKIDEIKTAQTKATIDMESIKSFQLGRTADEKESQITSQVDIQNRLDEQLKTLESAVKIFKHALNEMDGLESKKFTLYSDFDTYKKDLDSRIHKTEKDIIDESGSKELEETFTFNKVIKEEKFIDDVKQFKKYHSTN